MPFHAEDPAAEPDVAQGIFFEDNLKYLWKDPLSVTKNPQRARGSTTGDSDLQQHYPDCHYILRVQPVRAHSDLLFPVCLKWTSAT
ncbi:hypothetical protein chiPu_0002288 [Chiloscyllium punctatum]|uniref:Uncharacterized protein n=1 Tax=Chiloscyllium punctatum TaxID=137246 RepID=A0A401S0L9_CHIPU|nr:hypothetical protein [Chiloscyllium punctatum]